MKWMRNRFLSLTYILLLTTVVVVGCTNKQDPSETLVVCGNHSCGDLVMVTTDTSSDGFQYLDPKMSPDGSRILFTADWAAMPSDPKDPGDSDFVNNRQLVLIPNQIGVKPTLDLASQGAVLIRLFQRNVPYGGGSQSLATVLDDDKSFPIWQDDTHLIFSLRSVNLGDQYRIFRADISDPGLARIEPIFMEPIDDTSTPQNINHLGSSLSPDGRWLVFTRSGCVNAADLSTCSGVALWVVDMSTAADDDGYDALAFPITKEYSRIEAPSWSPDSRRVIFSGGMDVGNSGTGAGTEIYAADFDTTGLDAGTMPLDYKLKRLTFTSRDEGDPISGILNYGPVYSSDGQVIYFISTRRAPAITLHVRNLWKIPADGSTDPAVHYFTRSDEGNPSSLPDGRTLLSSSLGFPSEMLNRLEEESYQRLVAENEDLLLPLDEVQLRSKANDERRQLEFFEGVMSHIYTYRP
ncbi:MAG: Tol biopolymer transport system component [Candidatus Krumholzibacteriia bacterium]|jgi:Tol biopolymer transport system component